jgi:hypothetical protein
MYFLQGHRTIGFCGSGSKGLQEGQLWSVEKKFYTLIKKENKFFLIYQEIQSGAVAKSYMRKGFQIYKKISKYFPIYEEAVSYI